PAVDLEVDASDETAVVRCQKEGRCCQLFRAAKSAHGCRRCEGSLGRVSLLFRGELAIDDGCIGRSRTQRVDTNAAILELRSPRSCKGPYGRLCRAVNTMRGK